MADHIDPDPQSSARPDPVDPSASTTSRGDGDRPAESSTASAPDSQETSDRPQRQKWAGLSPTKIAGGALAAMTIAALGSRLGVAGTVGGAALVSAGVAVLDSVYTASLQRTQQGMQKVIRTVGPVAGDRLPRRRDPVTDHSSNDARSASPAPSSSEPSRDDARTTRPRSRNDGPRNESPRSKPPRRRRRRIVTATLAAAGLVFVVTLGGILGVELISGHSFNGEHGGTTIGQAVRGKNLTSSNRDGGSTDSDRPGGQESGRQQDPNGNNQQPDNDDRRNGDSNPDNSGNGNDNNPDNQSRNNNDSGGDSGGGSQQNKPAPGN